MTAEWAVVCLLAAASLIAAPSRPAAHRLHTLLPGAPGGRRGRQWRTGRPARQWDRARLTAVLCGVAIGVITGGWLGLALAVVCGLILDRVLPRRQPRSSRAHRLRMQADLPLAADLLAAVLRAGAPIDRASEEVGLALGGPLGERMVLVARALRLGASADEAWAHLDDVPGADRMSRAAIRSSASGAAVATALDRLAREIRAARLTAADAAARRASVLAVLPLGLCFLPAFVLAGLLPVIVAVLTKVL